MPNHLTHRFTFLILISLSLFACQPPSPPAPLQLPPGCNPLLAGADCMLPYPSDFFRVSGPGLPSAHRIQMTKAALPTALNQDSIDVSAGSPIDGFSKTPYIVALIDSPLAPDQFTGVLNDPEATLRANHPTLLLEADTGDLIPHFVDLDPRATAPLKQALILHPLIGLKENTRYIVALVALRTPNGEIAPAPEGFRRLRDQETTGDPNLAPLGERYEEEIFPPLKALKVKRSHLQLAWDFTTGSDQATAADMLTMRRLVLDELGRAPPSVTILSVTESDHPTVWRTITGTVTGPLVMESAEPGARVNRDAGGSLSLNGTVSFPFVAEVPHRIRERKTPGALLQFGHGFFGSRLEAQEDAVRNIAALTQSVVVAIDWWGMSVTDRGVLVSDIAGDLSESLRFSHRIYQGMANWLSLSEALRSQLPNAPAFHRPPLEGEALPQNERLLYTPDRLHFLGISQGALLGGTYTALSPHLSHSTLHVGGAGFSHIMLRSNNFAPFLFLMGLSLPDPLDQQKFIATLQPHADRFDPATYAPFLTRSSLPGAPRDRRVLMQAVLGDTSIPNFSSFLHGRLAGLPLVTPSPRSPFNFDAVPSPFNGSGMTLFDLGADDSFTQVADFPGALNRVHDELRFHPPALTQMQEFYATGNINAAP